MGASQRPGSEVVVLFVRQASTSGTSPRPDFEPLSSLHAKLHGAGLASSAYHNVAVPPPQLAAAPVDPGLRPSPALVSRPGRSRPIPVPLPRSSPRAHHYHLRRRSRDNRASGSSVPRVERGRLTRPTNHIHALRTSSKNPSTRRSETASTARAAVPPRPRDHPVNRSTSVLRRT